MDKITNSQGKVVAASHLEQQARHQQYVVALHDIISRREQNNNVWTDQLAQDYRTLLKQFGFISARW